MDKNKITKMATPQNGAILGAIFGIISGVVFGIMLKNFLGGVLFALIMAFVMAAFLGFIFSMVNKLRTFIVGNSGALKERIEQERKVIKEGPALLKKGNIYGQLFLSEDALEYYAHKISKNGKNFAILLDDIVKVEAVSKGIIVQSKTESFEFIVEEAEQWKKMIEEIL